MKMDTKFSGKVVPGDKYGRKIGFPTINLDTKAEDVLPGVYSGKGTINKKTYRAAIIVNENFRIDAYLFGYRGSAYGKIATLELKKFIRPFQKFNSEKELIDQIEKDLKKC